MLKIHYQVTSSFSWDWYCFTFNDINRTSACLKQPNLCFASWKLTMFVLRKTSLPVPFSCNQQVLVTCITPIWPVFVELTGLNQTRSWNRVTNHKSKPEGVEGFLSVDLTLNNKALHLNGVNNFYHVMGPLGVMRSFTPTQRWFIWFQGNHQWKDTRFKVWGLSQ